MNQPIIIANWKSNKTTEEAKSWWQTFSENLKKELPEQKKIIICPPFTLLPLLKETIEKTGLKISLGAQNISPFGEGAFTGEINGKQIKEFADYVIIGHSERRINLKEDAKILAEKAQDARDKAVSVIFCIQGEDTSIPESAEMIVYEPIFAIGTGNPEIPENAEKLAKAVKEQGKIFLYGGSVNSQNVASFTKKEDIDGVLVGGASLDPIEFARIVELA